jgi:pyridoxamine 5'-phosphate oxidase
MDQNELQNMRQDYSAAELTENSTKADPIKQFEKWFNEAVESGQHEPNAMTLSTSTYDGRPSGRIVLLKGFDASGFMFYTNYLSRKGKEITKNPLGTIEKLSKEQSEKYFHTRPRKSQMGAVASPQSQEIQDRELLEKKMDQLVEEYGDDKDIPKPSFWGGYVLKPRLVEFWQGRRSRLHDRILYKKIDNKNWKKVRLAP